MTEEEATLKAAALQARGFEVCFRCSGIHFPGENLKGPKDWSPRKVFGIRAEELVITEYVVEYRKPGTDEWERA